MGLSIIDALHNIIIESIRYATRGDWKVLIVDQQSRRLIDNVVKEDDILNENITHIEQIENKRPVNRDTDAVYILSAEPHIVDCVLADMERKRYRRMFLMWTSLLHPSQRQRLDRSKMAQEQIALFRVLNIDYFPRESHLVTLRDPFSFPLLYHPACNDLVREHIEDLAQKIVSVCVSLGEYPIIRFYSPRNPTHEAGVLCSHLARYVQEEIDMYAQCNESFPPPSNRPRGALYIVDRSMDLIAPFLHEFTYQAMAHDLLSIKEGDKVTFKAVINEGRADEEEKVMELNENDRIWIDNRHRHMKDTIEKIMGEFQKFIDQNPHFTNTENGATSGLSAIRDMLAGLPQFQEMKEAYSLHLSMTQDCMNIFQHHKLPDLASIEQSLATGLDEDYKKPKNLADQIIRTLDEEAITPSDRLRLIALYLLYKGGLVPGDLQKLLAHAQLPPPQVDVISGLEHLGAAVRRALKDSKPATQALFNRKPRPASAGQEEYSLSRYTPSLQLMLENHVRGTLDQNIFPYTKPHVDATEDFSSQEASAASLRSAKPTWAKSRFAATEPRQRVVIFMAGGATYSEARACYEISQSTSRDVYLATSHMQTPALFMRQLNDLSVDRRRLQLPADMPKPKAPAHLFEREAPPQPTTVSSSQPQRVMGLPPGPAPPTADMAKMSIGNGVSSTSLASQSLATPTKSSPAVSQEQQQQLKKGHKLSKETEKKKKHHFFSSKK